MNNDFSGQPSPLKPLVTSDLDGMVQLTWWDILFSLLPLAEMLIFMVLTVYSALAVKRLQQMNVGIRTASGQKTRRLFLLWITTALILKECFLCLWVLCEALLSWRKHQTFDEKRSVASIIKATENRRSQLKIVHIRGWVRNICRMLPNLLFLTSYLLLVGLWYTAVKKAKLRFGGDFDESRIGRIIVVSNIILYITFLITIIIELRYSHYELFRSTGYYIIGIAYLLLTLAWLWSGVRCLQTLKNRVNTHNTRELLIPYGSKEGLETDYLDQPESPQEIRKDPTFHNLKILVVVGSVVFTIKGVYNLCVATGVLDSYIPHMMPMNLTTLQNRLLWDVIFGCLTEALPVGLVVYLCGPTQKSSSPSLAATHGISLSLQNLLAERNSDFHHFQLI